MKAVTVDEFRAHVDEYLAEAATDDVVLTQDGKPCLVLNSEAFWKMIQERRQETGIPWEEAKKQLNLND
jgi:prevent-host-death family protein